MIVFYFIMFLLALVGIYHILEEIVWQIEKIRHHEEIQDMVDFMESRKSIRK